MSASRSPSPLDREVVSWVAKSHHLIGEDIRDLIAQASRSASARARCARRTRWSGSATTGRRTPRQTRAFGRLAGLLVCNTPAYSPESNGMGQAFVKTFKRDYVYLGELPDAQAVLRALPSWFDDYNDHHPHRGLGMRSPRQFRVEQVTAA